ncbi:MAG TPA: 2-deoxy-D-gluconate 3-dehydrogenase [Alphaproteobacteria bacterium]|jgi:2-dehydro-3-deoxy-D-gluconate 5-dehydrogenase|nr:2-deoxy-D-gluconate 3-dehydrogenase [Alphaproteobacteria bacterium]
MLDIFNLAGKVAIVTGGNGGIGLGIARGLANAGAAVAIVGRKQDKLDRAYENLKGIGPKILRVQADVSREEDVRRMVKETVEGLGRVDILFNNAAVSYGHNAASLPLAEWNNLLAINLTSVLLCSQAVYPEFKKAGGGKIINIGSIITQQMGHPKLIAYAAAKGGMDHMTQSLAVAWGPDNIQVNCVLPGLVDSEMMPCEGPNKQSKMIDQIVRVSPVRRYGVPDDFQALSVFLASRASNFVTGSLIVADGGLSLVI